MRFPFMHKERFVLPPLISQRRFNPPSPVQGTAVTLDAGYHMGFVDLYMNVGVSPSKLMIRMY
jgi:hypothetical protein